MDYLKNLNPHERDKHISFKEFGHVYTVKGKKDYTSVTTWVHSHFEKFDSDKVIANMMKSDKWTDSPYFGKTKQQIKDEWKKNGKESAEAGTKMHYDIECFYNNVDVNNDSIEYKYFTEFQEKYNLKPYRTEWMIWDEDYKLSGSIDFVAENEDGTLSIYDWKRCKKIDQNNPFRTSLTKCINYIPDSNYWHYCLQLNHYKHILTTKYDKKIKDMYLVCLHPNYDTYQLLQVEEIDLSELLQIRNKI